MKTIASPRLGIRTDRGTAGIVTADRPCRGAERGVRCGDAPACGRHAAYLSGSTLQPMGLPRVAGCACHYRTAGSVLLG